MTAIYAQLSDRYLKFMQALQKEQKISKKQILEEALELYMGKQKETQLKKAYQSMAQDEEYLLEMSKNAEDYLTV